MRRDRKRDQGADLVSAAEIAALVYCREAWRLRHALGPEPTYRKSLDAGTRHHEGEEAAERAASGVIGLEWLVFVLAVLGLLLLWVFSDDGDAVPSTLA
jgi:hypothetical protein